MRSFGVLFCAVLLCCACLFAPPASAQFEDIILGEGEVLLSVTTNGVTEYVHNRVHTQKAFRTPIRTALAAMHSAYVVNRDARAYAHALREAEYLARTRSSGHPYGVAPGCRYSGTGTSLSDTPNHCYDEWPESRLVARAVAVGSDGRFYWSAHYR